MSTSSRNKTLLFIIAVLLLTNIGVLVYFLGKHKPGPDKTQRRGSGLSEMLQREVGFNEDQVARYKELREKQWETLRPLFDDMRKAKDSLFRLMSDSQASDSVIQAAADVIALRQKALDLQAFQHFKRVRALCSSPEQMVKYDSAVLRMFRKMGKPARRSETKDERK